MAGRKAMLDQQWGGRGEASNLEIKRRNGLVYLAGNIYPPAFDR